MKLVYTLFTFLFVNAVIAQTTITFEEAIIEQDSFLNGSDLSGGFEFGSIFLPNDYNDDFMSWTGWALSNVVDTSTPGFFNQYACIAGSGNDDSENYATTFVLAQTVIDIDASPSEVIRGIHVNNSTYAYLSMLEGDAFAKKFGGETGDDPDYFLLTIKVVSDGMISTDSIDFYLADFRFEDNSMDYIVDEWTFIDVSSLGGGTSIPKTKLIFTLSSTDNGQFGMNTPAYFCLDDITIDLEGSNEEIDTNPISLFPNPCNEFLNLAAELPINYISIYDLNGLMVHSLEGDDIKEINISELAAGTYFLKSKTDEKNQITRFIKL